MMHRRVITSVLTHLPEGGHYGLFLTRYEDGTYWAYWAYVEKEKDPCR